MEGQHSDGQQSSWIKIRR